jgi:hypothetical protein
LRYGNAISRVERSQVLALHQRVVHGASGFPFRYWYVPRTQA